MSKTSRDTIVSDSYRCTGKDECEGTPKMTKEHKSNGSPDSHSIKPVVGATEQTQITDQESNLEETDAQLIEWSSSKVDSGIRKLTRFRAVGKR
jgi:hypothetical protein